MKRQAWIHLGKVKKREPRHRKIVAKYELPITMGIGLMLDYWDILAVRTISGTILPEASIINFSLEIQAYLQGYRTGVYVMNTSTQWAQTFLREHNILPQEANVTDLISIAEKELQAYVKHEKKAIEEKQKVSKNAEKALMKAFDAYGADVIEREIVVGIAIGELKIDLAQWGAMRDVLRSYVKEDHDRGEEGLFYIAQEKPTPKWGRRRNSKGEAIAVATPLVLTNGAGTSTAGGSKVPWRYTASVVRLGFPTKKLWLQAELELGATLDGDSIKDTTVTMDQLAAWLAKHK
jgi:hypothetical protein